MESEPDRQRSPVAELSSGSLGTPGILLFSHYVREQPANSLQHGHLQGQRGVGMAAEDVSVHGALQANAIVSAFRQCV